MGYSINTNITSLQAQEYLRTTSDFQSKTINRVTSGLRIISSGDDAAGLAIANSFRSDRAVLTQGVRNANDGLSILQTIDGGMNNISQLLDRARTLAAQSASGTFTGDRNILNSEFQSVLGEIDRQARAIGLDQGGEFAKSLTVFIGGGRSNAGVSAIDNGSVSVDLSQSTIDSKSLGMKGVEAIGTTGTDIGTGSATTSVQQIVSDATNLADLRTAGFSEFKFYGPGFADADGITIAVNTTGVTDTNTLVEAVNAAIDSAGNGASAAATAFRDAGIEATVNTDSSGKQQLAFNSSESAFQVKADDLMSNALMGNFNAGAVGASMDTTVTGDAVTQAGGTTFAGNATLTFRVQGAGLDAPLDLSVAVTAATTVTAAISALDTAISSNSMLSAAGITLTGSTAGAQLALTSTRGEKFDVQVTGDTANLLGMGSFQANSGAFDYTTITNTYTDPTAGNDGTATFEFSVNGAASDANSVAVTITGGTTTAANIVDALNAAFALDAEMKGAGLEASAVGDDITVASSNNTYFRMNVLAGANNGMGGVGATFTGNTSSNAPATASQTNSGGASASTAFTFGDLAYGADDQTITISANNSAGVAQTETIVLKNDGATDRAGRNIDQVIDLINDELQQTNNETLQKVLAVKVNDGGTEKIQFLSTVGSFDVSVGGTSSTNGIGSQGATDSSAVSAGGSTAAIDSQAGGQAAVSSLASAVASLGNAQADVGKGQNQFNFAVSLAQTQLNNLAASESRIRDADLAAEAANMTKAQILQQAGVAALAQANSAPQTVLSLLRG